MLFYFCIKTDSFFIEKELLLSCPLPALRRTDKMPAKGKGRGKGARPPKEAVKRMAGNEDNTHNNANQMKTYLAKSLTEGPEYSGTLRIVRVLKKPAADAAQVEGLALFPRFKNNILYAAFVKFFMRCSTSCYLLIYHDEEKPHHIPEVLGYLTSNNASDLKKELAAWEATGIKLSGKTAKEAGVEEEADAGNFEFDDGLDEADGGNESDHAEEEVNLDDL